jgi:hypothetical protein
MSDSRAAGGKTNWLIAFTDLSKDEEEAIIDHIAPSLKANHKIGIVSAAIGKYYKKVPVVGGSTYKKNLKVRYFISCLEMKKGTILPYNFRFCF